MTAIAFAVLASLALGQAAPQVPAANPEAGKTVKPPKEKKVCRSENVTGSMMSQKTCHTKAEWASIDETNNNRASDFRQHMQPHGLPQ